MINTLFKAEETLCFNNKTRQHSTCTCTENLSSHYWAKARQHVFIQFVRIHCRDSLPGTRSTDYLAALEPLVYLPLSRPIGSSSRTASKRSCLFPHATMCLISGLQPTTVSKRSVCNSNTLSLKKLSSEQGNNKDLS